jgi:hypothetical protein
MQAAVWVLMGPRAGDAVSIAGELWDGLAFICDVVANQLVAVECGSSFLLDANVTASVCLSPFDLKKLRQRIVLSYGVKPYYAPLEDPPES